MALLASQRSSTCLATATTPQVRHRIQDGLLQAYGGESGPLGAAQRIGARPPAHDRAHAARHTDPRNRRGGAGAQSGPGRQSWDDHLVEALVTAVGEERAGELKQVYGRAFPRRTRRMPRRGRPWPTSFRCLNSASPASRWLLPSRHWRNPCGTGGSRSTGPAAGVVGRGDPHPERVRRRSPRRTALRNRRPRRWSVTSTTSALRLPDQRCPTRTPSPSASATPSWRAGRRTRRRPAQHTGDHRRARLA